MKKIGLMLFGVLFVGSGFAGATDDLEVWTNAQREQFASAFELEIFASNDDARIFWTKSPNVSPAEGLMFEEPITITRSGAVYFFAFTPEPEVSYTPMKKQTFFVESKSGFEHLRIINVDPFTKKLTIKNFSQFTMPGEGWRLQSERDEILLGEYMFLPGETMEIEIPMKSVMPKIYLIAPNNNAEQLAALPVLSKKQFWQCTSHRSSSCAVSEK
jgi:hypothetical protein